MPRPWITLLVLVGIAGVGFAYVRDLHRENTGADADPIAALRARVAQLEDQLEKQKKENQRLLLELKNAVDGQIVSQAALENSQRPKPESQEASVEGVAKRVEKLRKLSFKKPVEFVPTTFEDIAQRITERVQAAISDSESEVRQRAYLAMGFVRDPFDYRWALTGLSIERTGWFYEPGSNKLYVNEDASMKLSEARGRMVRAQMEALLEQNYGIGQPTMGDPVNSDRALAAYAVLGGDSQLIQLHYNLSDVLGSKGSQSESGTPPPFYEAPIFMRERHDFPYTAGLSFHESLRQRPDSSAEGFLDRVYARMPVSTAEILHPDELYFAADPFEPVDYAWDDLQVSGVDPIESNVAGELNVRLLMKKVEAPDIAAKIAHGWRGDRYVVYPGNSNEGRSDQAFWRTVWATGEDAAEFASGMQKFVLWRFSIPQKKKYLTENGFIIDDPARPLRIRTSKDGKTVQVVMATEESFADALEQKFGMP